MAEDGWYIRQCMKLHYAVESRYPNFFTFGIFEEPPAEKVFERGHPGLLADLARYCARSYRWRPRSFAREMLQEKITNTFIFRRRAGTFSWWPGTLFWMPFSYVTLLFSFAFLVSLLLAVAPYALALLHDTQNEWLAAPVEGIWQALGFVVMWLLKLVFDFLELLSSMIIAFFTMLGGWLPAEFVSLFTRSAVVLGLGLAWLTAGVAWLLSYFEPLSPVIFWIPATIQEWVQGHTTHWVQSFLYELRIVFGVALLTGSSIGVIQLFFPWLASARAFGLIDPDGKSATIIFCGSTFVDNFMINACVWRYNDPLRHRGFHRAWSHIKPGVEKWLATKVPDDAEIILSGHSLGGAVAEIAAFDLAPAYSIKLVAALGSSRIGDPRMRAMYKERLDKDENSIHQRTWHITHADDIIPRLPPTRYFNHVGEGFLLSSDGGLYRGTRTSIFADYLGLIHRTGFFRFFFDLNMLTEKEKKYPGTEDLMYGQQLQIPPFKKFMWDARLLAFTVRDLLSGFFYVVVFAALLICIFGLLPYYGFAILKGVRFDHGVALYREALGTRQNLHWYAALLQGLENQSLQDTLRQQSDPRIPLLERPLGGFSLRGKQGSLLGGKWTSVFVPPTPDRPKD